MKTLFFSLLILFGTSHNTGLNNDNDFETNYKKVSNNQIKVKVSSDTGAPINNVLVKIIQDKRHLGETYTDINGRAIINCKYVADNDKNVQIIAGKDGYKDVNIKGNLITSITNFEFFLYENESTNSNPNTMNFTFQYEELKSPF
tara:strand:- start:866 stop:1300 length:435 start_codon:yes stop_codon:yes gene_type:complete